MGIDRKPDQCPICHVHVEPVAQNAYYFGNRIDIVWRCPSANCTRLFISYYDKNGRYQHSEPVYPEKVKIDENIANISKRFSDIYSQALIAKTNGLTELVGIGFRKALEILIKDYCIYKNAPEKDNIIKLSLHNCIETYCDGYVKKCAHKCRLLGNDEVHYERKFEDKDINDLENLIKTTLHWIGAELITNS